MAGKGRIDGEVEIIQDKQDSVTLKRNNKGEYSWDVKRYYNDEKTKKSDVLADIDGTTEKLEKKYGDKNGNK